MMWGNWNLADIQSALPVPTQDAAEIAKKRAAEQAVEDAGIANCMNCEEEIMKNELSVWESDFLLGYCSRSKDGRHKPLVKYVPTEGVVNAKRNSETHAEPVSEERTSS